MEKLSLVDIKKKNFSDVYAFIYGNSHSSKQSIAQGLHMSLPTVNQHLNALLEEGLIQQCGQLKSTIGRKAAAYSVVPDVRVAIGVEVLRHRVTIASVDLYGKLIHYQRIHTLFENTDDYYKKICDGVLDYIEKSGFTGEQILGVSFAMQGLVSSDNTRMTYAKILPMGDLTVEKFRRYLPYPCSLCHDSECAAASTLWYQPEITDAIYLSLSNHLGGAVIINGEIQHGRAGKSGTIEHMTLHENGIKCYCGQRGCAECYCSAVSFLQEDEDLDSFFEKKKAGDSGRQERWLEFLDNLSLLINNIHLVIDSFVILGGHIAPFMEEEDFDYLSRKIRETTAFPEDESFIIPGSRMPHEIPMGAAIGYIREFLDTI